MIELVVVVLILVCMGLGYALYRQQSRLTGIEQKLNQSQTDGRTSHDKWQHALAEAAEKQAEIAKRDALLTELRAQAAESQSRVQELDQRAVSAESVITDLRAQLADAEIRAQDLEQQTANTETLISTLRGQIQTSEQTSIESRALFSTLSSVAYDLVFVLNEDQIIIALNEAARDLFGQRNPIGDKLCQVIHSPDLEEIIARAETEDESLEEQIFYDNRHYRVRTQVMHYNNDHAFIGVAMQDVTQLVKLNRSRRDMVANISHELRTPIANIRLIIDSLFYDQNRPKRKASIASLRAIARETDTLLWLVQELLDLSMIESGQAIMKLVPTRLIDVVNDAVQRLHDQLDARGLKVAVHVPERVVVLCDYEQTRRVLMNLIHNAKKWSPPNDAITVNANIGDEEITVSIFDNGPGVPNDQTERIFERFYQIDTSRSGGDGTGLGLAICKHIIEAHGGRIWAEGNAAGNGGRFLFTLLNAGLQAPLPPQLPAAGAGAGQHDAGLNALIASRYEGVDEGEIELED